MAGVEMSSFGGAEVTIVYKTLPHYRVEFYSRLRERLAQDGIRLRLVVGQPVGIEALKNDLGTVPWQETVRNRALVFRGRTLIWQPVLRRVRGSDLVIVEQANKALVNYPLMVWRRLRGPKLAFWGHGFNRNHETALGWSEWVKRRLLRQCDWWFAYTTSTVRYLRLNGVPLDRVTDVQNAIDTRELRRLRLAVGCDTSASSGAADPADRPSVGLFVGSLYQSKRLPFLLEACDIIREHLPDFSLVIVGDGPERPLVEAAAAERPWLTYRGVELGDALARTAADATVMLMPGLVGLVILDAFALGLPIVTCAVENHSPEIDYLEPGANGVMLPGSTNTRQYAQAVVELLQDPERIAGLCRAADISAQRYTVENMVERFANGIRSCLMAGG